MDVQSTPTAAHNAGHGRIYFLDNMKATVILMVIIHHAAMGYMTTADPMWGIHDVSTSVFFDWLVAWDDAFIMPLMFWVSGYFAIGSAIKYPPLTYLKGKWFRIGWPWLLGIGVLAPITYGVAHPELVTGLLPYLSGFWTKHFYTAQYWYLNVLLWFYLLLLCVLKLCPIFGVRTEAPRLPNRAFFPFVIFLGFLGPFLLSFWVASSTWSLNPLFEIQYIRAPLYALFFFCGAWAWRNRWFQETGYHLDWKIWLPLGVLVSAVYFALRWSLYAYTIELPPLFLTFLDLFLRGVMSVVCAFAILSVFGRFGNITNPFWARLGLTAFAIYWIQQPVVTVFAKWSSSMDLNCFVKFVAVSLATVLVSYGVSAFILIKLPFFAPDAKK